MPDPQEPNPDWGGDWSVYQDLLLRRDAIQRGIDIHEARHPEWVGGKAVEPEPAS